MKIGPFLLGLTLTSSAFASSFGFTHIQKSQDNRYKELAESTAAMVEITRLVPKNRIEEVVSILKVVKETDPSFLSLYTPLFKAGQESICRYIRPLRQKGFVLKRLGQVKRHYLIVVGHLYQIAIL